MAHNGSVSGSTVLDVLDELVELRASVTTTFGDNPHESGCFGAGGDEPCCKVYALVVAARGGEAL